MTNRVDASNGPGDNGRVPYIAPVVSRIEDARVDVIGNEEVDDVGTDEPGATRDENSHLAGRAAGAAGADSGSTTLNRQPSPSLRTEICP